MLLSLDQGAHDEGGTTLDLETGLALGESEVVDEDGENAVGRGRLASAEEEKRESERLDFEEAVEKVKVSEGN